MLSQQLQHNFQVLVVLFLILAEHNNVIKVHKHKLANNISQHIVHDVLECARYAGQAEAQHPELKQTLRRGESCLRDIYKLEPDLIVGRLQVNATEHLGAMQLVKQLIYARQRVSVLYSLGIE